MTKKKFDAILKEINISRKEFAQLTTVQYTTVGKWNDTDRQIPGWVESWLENYIKAKVSDDIIGAVKPFVEGRFSKLHS